MICEQVDCACDGTSARPGIWSGDSQYDVGQRLLPSRVEVDLQASVLFYKQPHCIAYPSDFCVTELERGRGQMKPMAKIRPRHLRIFSDS